MFYFFFIHHLLAYMYICVSVWLDIGVHVTNNVQLYIYVYIYIYIYLPVDEELNVIPVPFNYT